MTQRRCLVVKGLHCVINHRMRCGGTGGGAGRRRVGGWGQWLIFGKGRV